ncbi:hypothetical protein LINGRAPRIM_LOCUS2861 [Linum grandiflorum]
MTIVLRFVDGKGLIQERFFDIVHDTLSSHKFSIQNLRGQGYDGASNMRGEWKGLQALFLKEFLHAYYIHCMAHRFTFILLLMKNIMGRTDMLCQTFQQKRLDIVNAMGMVEQTKNMLNELRQNGWDPFFTHVSEFCREHDIDVPVLCDQYTGERCSRKRHVVTNEHYYHFVDLLKLSSALDPTDGYKAFDADVICNLARKYYYRDFSEQEVEALEFQLRHFHLDVCEHLLLKNLSSVAELCHGLAETGKSRHYHLVDKLIRLVLTLPVSTATGERVFSAMKIVKNRLRSSMSDEFLADNLSIYIEREISDSFSLYVILQAFNDGKERRVRLTM